MPAYASTGDVWTPRSVKVPWKLLTALLTEVRQAPGIGVLLEIMPLGAMANYFVSAIGTTLSRVVVGHMSLTTRSELHRRHGVPLSPHLTSERQTRQNHPITTSQHRTYARHARLLEDYQQGARSWREAATVSGLDCLSSFYNFTHKLG